MRKLTAIALFLPALLASGCAARGSNLSAQNRSGADLLRAAEQSFSNIPFGTREPPSSLTLINDGGCVKGRGECTYIDANHVQHYFSDSEGALVVKSIELALVGERPIAALGIETARALDEVVDRVSRFLPEAVVACDKRGTADVTTCDATLGDGWVRLFFDSSRRLTEVRIDAYHFT